VSDLITKFSMQSKGIGKFHLKQFGYKKTAGFINCGFIKNEKNGWIY